MENTNVRTVEMSHNFAEIVEEVKQLSTEEKEELLDLLEKYLVDERRREIYGNYQASLKELDENRLNFSSNVDELREMLSHD
jgi:hypothetical protein